MKQKVIAILPAYKAKSTFKAVVDSLHAEVFDAIVFSDDCSGDGTFEAAKRDKRLTVIQTPRNLGYGGNLKYSLSVALEMGADIIIEIHPDGEYLADGILPALEKVKNGAHLVLGNRFKGSNKGMYEWKQIGTKLLTHIDNLALKTACGDLHQGFRVYTRTLLDNVAYKTYANDYLFSFEIIVDAIRLRMQVDEVPVSTRYTGNKRGTLPKAAVIYSIKTFRVLVKLASNYHAITQKIDKKIHCGICGSNHTVYLFSESNFTSVYNCYACGSGFTYPLKWNAASAYPESYYANTSLVYRIKSSVYAWCQRRRVSWVTGWIKGGSRILDVGSGEGVFGETLGGAYTVVNSEVSFARIVNSKVIRAITGADSFPGPFDAITYWESFEHMDDPRKELQRASGILKKSGYLLIEYPRIDGLESKIFKDHWYHLDIPRHRTHFSRIGLISLLESEGFDIISVSSVWAPEYALIGCAASLLRWTPNDLLEQVKRPLSVIKLLIALIVSCPAELILAILDESPIGLVIARKRT